MIRTQAGAGRRRAVTWSREERRRRARKVQKTGSRKKRTLRRRPTSARKRTLARSVSSTGVFVSPEDLYGEADWEPDEAERRGLAAPFDDAEW